MPRCATTAIIHLQTGMDIKKISSLFTEAHSVTHCSTRLNGDNKVNLTLDSKLQRESELIRKKSVTVQAEQLFSSALGQNCVQGEIPADPANLTLSAEGQAQLYESEIVPSKKFVTDMKKDVKAGVTVMENDKMYNHVKGLVKQGKILELTYVEQHDATWKSFLYNLPVGTMKFVLNSTINTLPTKDNLKQWGKVTNDKCFCRKKQTLNHVLSCCKKFLEEGRYTYRHDNILHYI